MADPHRPFLDTQHGGDLGGRHLLEVAHHQDLAIVGRQLRQRGLEPVVQFLAQERAIDARTWCQQPLGQPQDRLGRQAGLPGFLAGHAPTPRGDVLPVQLQQAIPGELPEPGIERQRLLTQVVIEPGISRGQGLLDHVRGIDPFRQPGIEPQADHLAKPRPVPLEQPRAGLGVALAAPAPPASRCRSCPIPSSCMPPLGYVTNPAIAGENVTRSFRNRNQILRIRPGHATSKIVK